MRFEEAAPPQRRGFSFPNAHLRPPTRPASFRPQTQPVAKRLCLSRAQAPSPKKTKDVSLKKRRRPCFSVPLEAACACYLRSPPGQGCISRCNQQQKEGGNPMTTKTLTKADLNHF